MTYHSVGYPLAFCLQIQPPEHDLAEAVSWQHEHVPARRWCCGSESYAHQACVQDDPLPTLSGVGSSQVPE